MIHDAAIQIVAESIAESSPLENYNIEIIEPEGWMNATGMRRQGLHNSSRKILLCEHRLYRVRLHIQLELAMLKGTEAELAISFTRRDRSYFSFINKCYSDVSEPDMKSLSSFAQREIAKTLDNESSFLASVSG